MATEDRLDPERRLDPEGRLDSERRPDAEGRLAVKGRPNTEGGLDSPRLLTMTFEQLDALFRASPSGPIPNGVAEGTAIIAAGTAFSSEIAAIVNIFAWKGKEFDAEHGTLTNRILPLGLNAIVAQVYKEPSWLDRQECIVLDYSKTSLVAHWVRDEIRSIGPGFYLGRVYWDKRAIIHFSLLFDEQ